MKKLFALLLACALLFSAAAAEDVRLDGSLGRLYGFLQLPAADGPAPLVILCHGFGGSLVGLLDYAAFFASNGVAAFAPDFCGGGLLSRSEGKMTDMSVLTEAADLNAVIDLFAGDPRFTDIFLMGESQGGFVASYVAAQRPGDVKALILEYPAYVLVDDAKRRRLPDGTFPETGRLLGMTIGRGYSEALAGMDIYAHIAAYDGSVLILHGDSDPLVPLSYSERARKAFPHAVLTVLEGQGHGFRGAGRRSAMEAELSFILENLSAAPGAENASPD